MKSHILFVEDDHKARRLLTNRLLHAGYEVMQASDGEMALDLLEMQTFDVVLTDIVMGDVSGIEVMHTARMQPHPPEVIVLTGHGSLDTAIAAVRDGAYDYLLKPCSAETLLVRIENALQRRQQAQKIRDAANTMMTALQGLSTQEKEKIAFAQGGSSAPLQSDKKLLQIGPLTIGITRHDVLLHSEIVHVTPIEFLLLRYLAEHLGQFRTSREIIRHTHGMEMPYTEAQKLLRSHIRNLRKKLGHAFIANNHGSYMLVSPKREEE